MTPAETNRLNLLRLRKKKAGAKAVKDKSFSPAEDLGGIAQSIGQGLIPFYDEIGSGIRSLVDPTLYGDDSTIGERYDVAQAQANRGLSKVRDKYPELSFASEATAGFISPINKIGGVAQQAPGLVNAVKEIGRNVVRNAAEAGIYGFGSGEGENRIQSGLDAAKTGALVTGALDSGGRTIGKGLEMWRLPNAVRTDVPVPDIPSAPGDVRPPLRQPAIKGETAPIHISNPRSIRGGIVRQGLGRLPGANEALVEQSIPTINAARAKVADAEAGFETQGRNLETHQNTRQRDLGLDQQARADEITGRSRGERERIELENQQVNDAIDLDARRVTNAIDERVAGEGLDRAVEDARLSQLEFDDEVATRVASEESRVALNNEVLQASVPADRQHNVTAGGKEGFNQAKAEVKAAYDEAWSVDNFDADTMNSVVDQAETASKMLGESDARLLARIVKDAKKIQEAGGSIAVLDEQIRNAINATEDQIVRADLEAIRSTLRGGLPEDNQALLQAVDDVYPTFLVAEGGQAASTGIPTAEQYRTQSSRVGGRSRTAQGTSPMQERIEADIDTSPSPIADPVDNTGGLERSRALELERAVAAENARLAKAQRSRTASGEQSRVADAAADERLVEGREVAREADDLSGINAAERQRLSDTEAEVLGPLRVTRDQNLADAKLPNESLYMAALLSGILPGGGPALPRAGGVIQAGRKLASPSGQRSLAGQGDYTTALIDYLRSGRSEYVTRAGSLAASKSMLEEERENAKR